MAIREHTTLDASEPLRRGNHAHVLATPAAMAARFEDHPDAVAETERLAATLTFDLTADLGYRYPGAEDDERRPQARRGLRSALRRALPARAPAARRGDRAAGPGAGADPRPRAVGVLPAAPRDARARARGGAPRCAGADTARALLPPGRGRGSSVSSIVCYLTGLSHVDPIANELLLGRFLNEEITALPDIDLDFPRDVREVLIPRVHERFGREHSALVAAFPTYRARGAIRELGKALGLPPGEIERVARSLGGVLGADRRQGHRRRAGRGPRRPKAAGAGCTSWPHEAHGLPRHLSQHSGGMIVATRPLIDCCPVVPAAMEGRQMVMWDKDSCSDAGFLKIDLLGLGMLSAVERCVRDDRRAARRARSTCRGSRCDDPATFDVHPERRDDRRLPDREPRADGLAAAHAAREPEDLTIQVAIVRPGPIVGGAVNPYIERLPAAAGRPALRGALRPPVAGGRAGRHARDDHLPGPGHRGRDGVRRASRRARPRGCGGR